EPLGLTGAEAAAPLWRKALGKAVELEGSQPPEQPDDLVEALIDPETGLRVGSWGFGERRREIFRRDAQPRRDHWFWFDDPEPVVE
nr:hypothetical protein [Thermoanaerobaculia bacterium]